MSEKKDSYTKNALLSFSDSIETVADNVSQSVVSIRPRGGGSGSGVVWTIDGHIVTCSHLIRRADEVQVRLNNGISFPAKVIGNDPYSDVALLKIEANNTGTTPIKQIEIADSENLKAGQFVLALANPYGEYPSITQGIITSERSSITGWWSRGASTMMDNIVITDALLNPGYSGGPLVDVEGKMIGLNAAYISSRGIAIRANKVRSIADQLAKDRMIKRAHLGIVTEDISLPPDVSSQVDPKQEGGLIVLSVEEASAAKKAGLFIGDVIVKFNGEAITNVHDLRRHLLKQDIIGKSAKLAIIRADRKTELTVTPDEGVRSN